eukprot:m51a1_g3079 hypothetical protein (196) ;mRNA; f:53100-54144
MSPISKFKPLVTPIILLVFWAIQVAALCVVDWPSAKSIGDICDFISGWWCRMLHGLQASKVFGILAVLVGSFVLIATILTAIQSLHSLAKRLRVLCSPLARWLFVGGCILIVLFCFLASVIWPGAFNNGKPDGAGNFCDDRNARKWLALQLAALVLAIAATVTAFFCSSTDRAASSSSSSSSGSKPAEAPAPVAP